MARFQDSLAANISADVNNRPVMGLIQKVVVIPQNILTRANISLNSSTPRSLIDSITLSSTGFAFECLEDHDFIEMTVENRGGADTISKFGHVLSGLRVLDPSAAIYDDIVAALTGGNRYFAVAKVRYAGTDLEDGYKFLGYDVGLKFNLQEYGSKANDGAMVLSLSTPEGEHETQPPRIYLNTDYTTTEAEFASNFAP